MEVKFDNLFCVMAKEDTTNDCTIKYDHMLNFSTVSTDTVSTVRDIPKVLSDISYITV